MPNVLVLHGPNLNLLGTREPETYGYETLAHINDALTSKADQLGLQLTAFQSNAEHALIDRIQQCQHDGTDFLIVNLAAFTHTSIALRDALLAIHKPFVEVHLSNLAKRETYRQHSYVADIAIGTISGLGAQGYLLALDYTTHYLKRSSQSLWICEKSEN